MANTVSTSDAVSRLGGLDGLRSLVADFYVRVFDDVMIGYLFKGVDRQRLEDLEVQFVARFFGHDVAYEGRGMRQAHHHVRILRGHFLRRRQLLVETLADHGVPMDLQVAWLAHVDALMPAVLSSPGAHDDCLEDDA